MKPETLKRWGVVLTGRGKNRDLLLGWLWWPEVVCANAQPWPAVWLTRKGAEKAAKQRQFTARLHSPHWRFRVVRISMTVRVGRG